MASHNLFTEEGRTRFRNFGVRLRSYLLDFLGLGLLAGASACSSADRLPAKQGEIE
jgi:hypothetical protein